MKEKLKLERVVRIRGKQPCRHKRQQKEGQEVLIPSAPGKSVVGQLCLLPGAPGGSTAEQEGSKEAVSWWEGHTAGKVLAGPVDY